MTNNKQTKGILFSVQNETMKRQRGMHLSTNQHIDKTRPTIQIDTWKQLSQGPQCRGVSGVRNTVIGKIQRK